MHWLVERCGESLQIFARSESFGKDMTNLSTCVRELSDDAMPMPTKVPRAHHQASEVQEHAATAGLSKFHFHVSREEESFVQLFFVLGSRSIAISLIPIRSRIGLGPYVSSQSRDTFSL